MPTTLEKRGSRGARQALPGSARAGRPGLAGLRAETAADIRLVAAVLAGAILVGLAVVWRSLA